ncbi:hypothetical protein [Oceaniglobus indicus]|uniref:hypothetical protein n=1 Tax=Oceaniglobus indicus TaxID=2047749 RepID=UPI000C1910FE|nr:hypothetical protein [Oceaniglobus indicus]
MNTTQLSSNIDDLAATAIRLGREVAEQARVLHLGRTARDVAFVARCLASLRDREPFCASVEGGLDAVRDILERDIEAEKTGTDHRFVETRFDEAGQHGEVREVPVYTRRGAELLDLQNLFDRFVETRRSVLDHIAAHKVLMRNMTG